MFIVFHVYKYMECHTLTVCKDIDFHASHRQSQNFLLVAQFMSDCTVTKSQN